MSKKDKKLCEKIKSYHILLLSIILCPLIMINSNYAVEKREEEKLYEEASKKFERILMGRKLESFEEGTKKICDSGSDKLKEYYMTGDKSKIGLKDKEEKDGETPDYVNALLDLLKGAGGEESENSLEDNAMTYGKHILGSLVFIVIAFLSLIGWAVCCSCCCCNCCCCCCCKKAICKLPFLIITFACYALVIAVSIYGLAESNIIFVGISDTECSFLKFFNETIEGESKVNTPKWAGITGINELLESVKQQIENTGSATLVSLDQQDTNITGKQTAFEDLLQTNSKAVTKKGENKESIGGQDYRLDISAKSMYGVFDKTHKETEPRESFMGYWYKEYSGIADKSKESINEAKTNFDTVLKSGELTRSLEDGQKEVENIGNSINDIKESISGMIIDYSDDINDYGKLGFKIVFSVLAVFDAAIAAFMLLLFIFSGKLCNKCCCCRCAFKIVIHLLWNIFALLMFLTLLIGSIFTIIGTLGKDFISVINYLVSDKNLNGEKPLFIGDEGKKINACFNGNGDILTELGFNLTEMDAINQLYDLYDQIALIEKEFQKLRESEQGTYYVMKSELEKRVNYDTTEFHVFLDNDSTSPSGGFELKNLVNDFIQASGERWSFHCDNADSSCKNLKDTDLVSGLPTEYSNDAKAIGGKIQSIKNLVSNAETGTNGFKKLTEALFDSYNIFLDSEIIALGVFKEKIKDLTGIFEKYVGKNGKAVDFVNCKFLGTNLKVILKNLKDSLGSNLYAVGICLILSGCSIAISIVFTILLIVIINQSVDANKKT